MNKHTKLSLKITLTCGLAAMATGAMAHTGHGVHGLQAGLAHPFMGVDHLLAMLAVGLWSAVATKGASRWVAPLAFMAALLLGAVLAVEGVAFAGAESVVALSLVAFGALLALGAKLPAGLGWSLIAMGGYAHGWAHGSEVEGAFAAYAAGFLIASALLHGIGLLLGDKILRGQEQLSRVVGAAIAGAGLAMTVGVL